MDSKSPAESDMQVMQNSFVNLQTQIDDMVAYCKQIENDKKELVDKYNGLVEEYNKNVNYTQKLHEMLKDFEVNDLDKVIKDMQSMMSDEERTKVEIEVQKMVARLEQ